MQFLIPVFTDFVLFCFCTADKSGRYRGAKRLNGVLLITSEVCSMSHGRASKYLTNNNIFYFTVFYTRNLGFKVH